MLSVARVQPSERARTISRQVYLHIAMATRAYFWTMSSCGLSGSWNRVLCLLLLLFEYLIYLLAWHTHPQIIPAAVWKLQAVRLPLHMSATKPTKAVDCDSDEALRVITRMVTTALPPHRSAKA